MDTDPIQPAVPTPATGTEGTSDVAREIAPDVYCLGPKGRSRTNVYFVRSGSSWTLIDAGWAKDGPAIRTAAEAAFGADTRPASILLTHAHPDHSGSALELARAWDCVVYLHPAELPLATGDFAAIKAYAGPLDAWLIVPLMRGMGRRRREAMLARSSLRDVARSLAPGAGVPGLVQAGSASPRRATRRATSRSFEPVTTC